MKVEKVQFIGIVIILFFNNQIFSQGVSLDDSPFKMEFIRNKTNSKLLHRTSHRTSRDAKFINVRVKLTSKTGSKVGFDPNPISLIVDSYKQRIRPTDFDYPILHLNSSMNRVLIEYDKDIVRLAGYVYNPEIPDSFENYNYKDYQNITHSYKWGNTKNAKEISYYYEVREFKERKANLIFLVPKEIEKASLYYGDQWIYDITVR